MCIWEKDGKQLDVPEDKPLIAYKVLRQSYAPLHSPSFPACVWKEGVPVTADPAPAVHRLDYRGRTRRDTHGIYCFESLKAARAYYGSNKGYVVVKLEVWGSVVAHAREVSTYKQTTRAAAGYRVEHARIAKVYDA